MSTNGEWTNVRRNVIFTGRGTLIGEVTIRLLKKKIGAQKTTLAQRAVANTYLRTLGDRGSNNFRVQFPRDEEPRFRG